MEFLAKIDVLHRFRLPSIDYCFGKNPDGLPTIDDLLQLNEIQSRLSRREFGKKDLTSIANAVVLLVLAENHRKQ